MIQMLQFNNQLKFIAIIMVHKGLFHSKNHHRMTIKEKTDMNLGAYLTAHTKKTYCQTSYFVYILRYNNSLQFFNI